MQSTSKFLSTQMLILGIVLFVFTALMTQYWPLGADYLHTYRPVTRDWLHGDTRLYDGHGYGFYNLPWVVMLLIPFTLMPLHLGQALLNVTSIVCLVITIDIFRRDRRIPPHVTLLVLGNLYVVDLLIRGQIDAFVLLGVALGWWAVVTHKPLLLGLALCLLAIKPVNVALVGLLYLLAIRHWPRQDSLMVFSIPAIVFSLSLLLAGVDWPLRLVQYMRDYPVARHRSIDIWSIALMIGLPLWIVAIATMIAVGTFLREAWRQDVTLWTVSLAMTTNFAFTYYSGGYHYILMIPALLLIASHRRVLLALAYLATWTPLIRLMDSTVTHWDYIFTVIMFLSVWALAPRERGRRPMFPQHASLPADEQLARSTPV